MHINRTSTFRLGRNGKPVHLLEIMDGIVVELERPEIESPNDFTLTLLISASPHHYNALKRQFGG